MDWLERIAIALDCHPFDLLEPDPALMKFTGASPTVVEQQLIARFRRFSVEQQEAILGLMKTVVCGGNFDQTGQSTTG